MYASNELKETPHLFPGEPPLERFPSTFRPGRDGEHRQHVGELLRRLFPRRSTSASQLLLRLAQSTIMRPEELERLGHGRHRRRGRADLVGDGSNRRGRGGDAVALVFGEPLNAQLELLFQLLVLLGELALEFLGVFFRRCGLLGVRSVGRSRGLRGLVLDHHDLE